MPHPAQFRFDPLSATLIYTSHARRCSARIGETYPSIEPGRPAAKLVRVVLDEHEKPAHVEIERSTPKGPKRSMIEARTMFSGYRCHVEPVERAPEAVRRVRRVPVTVEAISALDVLSELERIRALLERFAEALGVKIEGGTTS